MIAFIKNNFKKKYTKQKKNINKFFIEEIKKKYLYSMHKKINSDIPINYLKKNKYLFNI